MVKRDPDMYKEWRLPGFIVALWVFMFLLYSCHAVPAKEYKKVLTYSESYVINKVFVDTN